jgi:hypothetical protein
MVRLDRKNRLIRKAPVVAARIAEWTLLED